MADEIELTRRVSRKARAEALQRDELLIEAFATLDADYIQAWRQTHINDTVARERLWQAIQIVAKVRDHLRIVVDQGKLAQKELDALAGKRTKVLGVL